MVLMVFEALSCEGGAVVRKVHGNSMRWGTISKIRLYLRHFRERDDVLKVWGGIYLRYFASTQKGAVLQVHGGGDIYCTF